MKTALEKRVEKFIPRIYFETEPGSTYDDYRTAYYPRMSVRDAEKFGLEDQPIEWYGVSHARGFSFGTWQGKRAKWCKRYGREYYGDKCGAQGQGQGIAKGLGNAVTYAFTRYI